MNDFLSNVIAKNFNFAPVVQPRLPSLFEPPAAAGKLFAEQPASFAGLETTLPATENTFNFHEPVLPMAHPAFAAARPQPPTTTSLQISQVESLPTPDETIMTMKPAAPLQPNPTLRPALLPAVETERERPSGRTALDAAPIVPPGSNLRPAASEPPIVTRATPIIQAALIPPARVENDTAPRRGAPEQLRQHTRESPDIERTMIERVVAPMERPLAVVAPRAPSVVALPQIKPYVAPILPAKAVEKSEPAPSIQVTIGRIEVRATPPPSSSKRQPATPRVMSLEEYLRQRAGGGRP